jgi:hypothetical protein
MFVIRSIDRHQRPSINGSIANDIKDIADIVTGITGSRVIGNSASVYAESMCFGDKFSDFGWGYSIECFQEL